MIHISLNNTKNKEKIENIASELKGKVKIHEINTIKNEDSYNKSKKSKIVFCNDNLEKIAYFLSLGKVVVVFNEKKNVDSYNQFLKKNMLYTYKDENELIDILEYLISKDKRKKIANNIMILTLSFIIAFSIILNFNKIYKNENINKDKKNIITIKDKEESIDEEKTKEVEIDFGKENIVFFGDSITDYYDLESYYEDIPVVNSGISGNQTKDLLNGLDERVIRYNPTKVFLLIGTNDIAFTDLSDEEIADNIIEIATNIRDKRKNVKIYIEAIYPISKEENDTVQGWMVGERENSRIKSINSKVKKLCKEENFVYIDMYSLLVNDNDNLEEKYTKDGLHLSDKGYEVITKEIKKYINEEL